MMMKTIRFSLNPFEIRVSFEQELFSKQIFRL